MEKLKIRENDVLWNLYLKADLGEKPKTLCQYFSGAMLGAFLHYYIFNRFARLALAALSLTCVVNLYEVQADAWYYTLPLLIMIPSVIIALVGECCEWGISVNERVVDLIGKIVLGLIFFAVSALAITTLCLGFANSTITWWGALHDLCVLIGGTVLALMVIVGFLLGVHYVKNKFDFSPVKRLGSQIWQYMLAIKNRACPLVDAPEIKAIK